MQPYLPYLEWIYDNKQKMITQLEQWSNINSGTNNLTGLASMVFAIQSFCKELNADSKIVPLPDRITINSRGEVVHEACGNALLIKKHPKAPMHVLLAGHMDTVYSIEDAFQKIEYVDDNTMKGPGVADMKGGLIVMITALKALERSPVAGNIGWELIINPDEEVGSPSSAPLFQQAAKRNHLGLVYEPSFPDGALVSKRKGSANFIAVMKGRAAHAGRDIHQGRNALVALAKLILKLEALGSRERGITVNVGHMEGGGPINIVPALATCKFNLRMEDNDDMYWLQKQLKHLVDEVNSQDGISITLHELVSRPPKPYDQKTKQLFAAMHECATDLGIELTARQSGGVCDGNILAAAGLPTLDTMGVIGGNIHTPEEYVLLESLPQRAMLSAYFLIKLAKQDFTTNPTSRAEELTE